MVENVGAAVRIALPSVSVQKVISTSGLMAAILHSGCRSMSDNVRSAIPKLGMVENMG